MALTNFDNWRDRLDEMLDGMGGKPPAVAQDPAASIKGLKKGIVGLSSSPIAKAQPFIDSIKNLEPMYKIKLFAELMRQVGINPADLAKIKSRM